MKTSDLARELCKKQHISLAGLGRRIGQSPQSPNKKLKKDAFSMEELNQIAGPRVQDLISVLYFLVEQKSQMKRCKKNEYQQY